MKPNDLHEECREALYYQAVSDGVKCKLCPHGCHLSEGQHGLCKGRVCKGGKLYSAVYAHPCALHTDPVEKKPLFHFYPGCRTLSVATVGCNFACSNCQNWEISQSGITVNTEYVMPRQLVDTCLHYDCPAIAYTYTEPLTYYEYMYDTAVLAHGQGIRNIMVSAGFVNAEPLRHLCQVIDAANVDLKSFSDDLYRRINHGRLQPVLDTLMMLKDAGVWLEITNLLIPTVNDDWNMIKEMCQWLFHHGFEDTPLHFSRFFPMYKMRGIPPTPIGSLLKARQVATDAGLRYVYIGNVNEVEGENTFCPNCHRLLIRRDGYRVLQNEVDAVGQCPFCHFSIAGRWQ